MDEPRVISLCITHMLATLHEFDNDNVPTPIKPKGWRAFVARLVGSNQNDSPAGVSSLSLTEAEAGMGEPASP
jgi:hypothetical protein